MRPDFVVVPPPKLDLLLRVGEIDKPVGIEALVSKLAVEAFDVAVLGRLAWPDEVQLHAPLEGPGIERLGDELRTVVDANALRIAAHGHQKREHGDDVLASDRRVHLDDQALAREAVDDAQRAEGAATGGAFVRATPRPSFATPPRLRPLPSRHRP